MQALVHMNQTDRNGSEKDLEKLNRLMYAWYFLYFDTNVYE